ncbi:MAG TPA: ATP-binding protein [Solirubrobacteraceae bacterium]|nr:ATP-binding protein [Solirubrobacteraceae bacterium]
MEVFVNRSEELAALERWWNEAETSRIALVWGRRRVGKTALIERFASGRRTLFHTASARPLPDELHLFARSLAPFAAEIGRDCSHRPPADWEEALTAAADCAREQPLLLVIDELPELLRTTPELPSVLRAILERAGPSTHLRRLLCGSAVRVMEAMRQERETLYGRIDLSLLVHPFRPHEIAPMLGSLAPPERALVWGLLGGIPLYLSRWRCEQDPRSNLLHLVCSPGGKLLEEGRLVLATEADAGDLAQRTLRAIASGRTKHAELRSALRADPSRTLERLIELRLIERLEAVTAHGLPTRRRTYRIPDNFLAFWLALIEPSSGEIERGLGPSIVDAMIAALDDHMGPRYEDAFRTTLRRLAAAGCLGPQIVAVGPFWSDRPSVEIDAVVLAGRRREAVLVGEAKWRRVVDARPLLADLRRKSEALPIRAEHLRYALCARERVDHAEPTTLALGARNIF